MNFRELIDQLNTIDCPVLAETVTLDSIMAAVGKETDERKRADLLQKMAEKENLPGLYDPVSGYFVSVFQDRNPGTNQLQARISSTASSAVTNQLADLGLVPGKANTRSLGGLIGVGALSNSTEKNDEMDQEVKNRFTKKQPVAQPVTSNDQLAQMARLEQLVDQYVKLKKQSAPAVKETQLARSIVESFGYTKNQTLEQLVESFGYRKTYPYGTKYISEAGEEDANFDADAYIKNNPKVNAGRTYVSADTLKSVGTAWQTKDLSEIRFDDEIIPNVYSFADLCMDLGIAAGSVLVGTLMAPFTAGASAAVGYTVAGGIFVRMLVRIAYSVLKATKLLGDPFVQLVKIKPIEAARAVGRITTTFVKAFVEGITKNFGALRFMLLALATAGFNGAVNLIKAYMPDTYAQLAKAGNYVGDKLSPIVDKGKSMMGFEGLTA